MEWMAIIGDSIQYIEEHITEDVTADEVAKAVGVSPFYFQKGFAMLCGFSVAEYIRNRRLALAGNDLLIIYFASWVVFLAKFDRIYTGFQGFK